MMKSITVFAGSSSGTDERYTEKAKELGTLMAKNGITLVYGGGYCGLMGTVAEAVSSNGGKVIGVLPESMNRKTVRQKEVETEVIIVPDMHQRKRTMYSLAEGFIALPGGIGTMEELMEIYTWRQLRLHEFNIGLLNVSGYWDPLIEMTDKAVSCGFLSKSVRDLLIAEEDPIALLERLEEKTGPAPDKIQALSVPRA